MLWCLTPAGSLSRDLVTCSGSSGLTCHTEALPSSLSVKLTRSSESTGWSKRGKETGGERGRGEGIKGGEEEAISGKEERVEEDRRGGEDLRTEQVTEEEEGGAGGGEEGDGGAGTTREMRGESVGERGGGRPSSSHEGWGCGSRDGLSRGES